MERTGEPIQARPAFAFGYGEPPIRSLVMPRQSRTRTETKEQRAARLKAEQERRARQRAQSTAIVVYPFAEWCTLRGLSVPTGRRLVAARRVKVTYLSERRIGVRSDHDEEYLTSCARDE
jgi:hypothetical protein